MEEINNFQQEPDETLYQAWEHIKELLMKCPQHYLTEMQEMPKQPSKKWLNTLKNGTMEHLEEEIKKVNEKVYAAQVRWEQCKGPHYTKDCPQKEEGKTLEEAYYTNLNSTPLYKARQTTAPFPNRLDNHYCKEEGNYGPKFTEACGALCFNNVIPQKEKDPRSFTLPCFINDFCFDNALILQVLENMDAYRDEGMAMLFLAEPFIREVDIKRKLSKELITLLQRPIRRIHQGRYGVSVPALTKDHKRNEDQYACITRSSTNELYTPYKDPEREFRSSRRHFKTLSLDELSYPDFNLLFDEDYSKEGEEEEMAETMEQYMSKT
ncbi:hypothetical protein Tco_0103985 [Tanacetum coccineum]